MDRFLPCLHPQPGGSDGQFPDSSESMSSLAQGMIGKHCILELYECNKHKLNDEAFVRTTLTSSAKLAGAKLINMITHRFHPQGITGLALLAESHLSLHSWPEIGYGAVDVFTCGEHTNPQKACENFVKEFEAKTFALKILKRQTPYELLNLSRKSNI
tara:strand:+ start:2177 stop:2650 length:474 start_codon:yes stop_codon:yes gene_type:complete